MVKISDIRRMFRITTTAHGVRIDASRALEMVKRLEKLIKAYEQEPKESTWLDMVATGRILRIRFTRFHDN